MVMAEQLTDPLAYHAEGAAWFDGWGGLKWVDMLAGAVLSLDGATGTVSRFETGSSVAAMVRPRASGGVVIATEREFTLWDADGSLSTRTAPLWPEATSRLNEGGCTPDGALLCGSLAHSRETGTGEMFRLDEDGSVKRLFGDVTISNGLGFTAAGDSMYYIDSRTRRVDIFDYADGQLSNRRPFVAIQEGKGSPDGLWVDELDGVWVALYNGSAVHHYDAEGSLQDVIELPVRQITSCTFGGDDMSTLFITTSRENLPDDVQLQAGSIFQADAGVRGRPILQFAG